MFAVGNQSSVRYPSGVNPEQSWNTSSKAKYRVVLMLLFPIISLPTSLAYLARWAFHSDVAFYAGMTVAALIAIILYLVSLDSAIEYARAKREHLVGLLGNNEAGG
jgi:NADH:ubiquinone oxidoreductase subunit 3 (subunit A)